MPENEKNENLEIDPNLLIESIDDVHALEQAHETILKAMKSMTWRFMKGGMKPDEAAMAAYTLHRHAAEKARTKVPNTTPEEDAAEMKKEEKEDDHTETDG